MKIQYETDNAAFGDNPNEHAEILMWIIMDINSGKTSGVIRDTNGNKIGKWER